MRIVKITAVLCLLCTRTFAQPYPAAAIKTIEAARDYITQTLKLETGDDFYTVQADSTQVLRTQAAMYCYVYAAQKNALKPVFDAPFKYFDTDHTAARHYADSLQALGYDIMLYHTAGTSAAKLTARMLHYPSNSIAFIMLHESIHRHRQNTDSPLPYIFEEALCDLVANTHVGKVTGDDLIDLYIDCNEQIYGLVNDALAGKISKAKCYKRIQKILTRSDAFQRDRFNYEVNNAFLLRYTSYCKYYFLLLKCSQRYDNPAMFYKWVFALKGTEAEIAAALEALSKGKEIIY